MNGTIPVRVQYHCTPLSHREQFVFLSHSFKNHNWATFCTDSRHYFQEQNISSTVLRIRNILMCIWMFKFRGAAHQYPALNVKTTLSFSIKGSDTSAYEATSVSALLSVPSPKKYIFFFLITFYEMFLITFNTWICTFYYIYNNLILKEYCRHNSYLQYQQYSMTL